MKLTQLTFKKSWQVIAGTSRSQAAVMIVRPGQPEGGPTNTHTGDQWLFVIDGKGKATVNGKDVKLKPGALLLIKKGERHQINANPKSKLVTLNFYSPPQY